jgi:hypothetical protein
VSWVGNPAPVIRPDRTIVQPIGRVADYVVRWRRTDSSNWTEERRGVECESLLIARRQPGGTILGSPALCIVVLRGIRVDDWVFGVSSVSKDGFESPVASAVPGGAFKPWVKPAEEKK